MSVAIRRVAFALWLAAGGCDDATATPDPDESEPWTLENVCPRFAEEWCEAASGCCQTEGFGFDPAGCAARYTREVCAPLVRLVDDGRVRFDLASYSVAHADAIVEECIETWRAHFNSCGNVTFYDAYHLLGQHNVVCNLFTGLAPVGGACTARADCSKTLDGADKWIACFKDHTEELPDAPGAGTCNVHALQAEGLPCSHRQICSRALYCKAPAGELGRCERVVGYGEACEPDPASDACGFEGYCDPEDAVCKRAAKGKGEACAASPGPSVDFPVHECQSQTCAFGLCTHPLFWFDGPYFAKTYLDTAVCTGGDG